MPFVPKSRNNTSLNRNVLKAPEVRSLDSKIFGAIQGHMFSEWITDYSRSTGYAVGNLIENPSYVIESFIRDFILAEYGLVAESGTVTNVIRCSQLKGYKANYYDDAIIHNITRNQKSRAFPNAFLSNSKDLILVTGIQSQTSGDKFFVTNINGNQRVNKSTFDEVAQDRSGWLFASSITDRKKASEHLRDMLFESHSILSTSQKKYRLSSLDGDSSAPILQTEYYQDGEPTWSFDYSDMGDVYSEFRLKYKENYASGTYDREIYISPSSSPAGLEIYKSKCNDAKHRYRKDNPYEYECKYIRDEVTAIAFIKKLVDYFTTQHMIFSITGYCEDLLKYEIGDKVRLNYDAIPTVKRNQSFIVIHNELIMGSNMIPQVLLTLYELP